jgi:ubiquinone biosynthesis protein
VLFRITRTLSTVRRTIVFGLRIASPRVRRSEKGPKLLKRYLEECGGAFVKLGQFLSMRLDLLSLPYCQELESLLDQLPPSPVEDIIRSIESDLGRPVHQSFAEFDPVPVSSASVAQVHAARLLGGERVVVKVKHPGIEELFRCDIRNARFLARVAAVTGVFGRIDVRALADEFVQLTQEELDFGHETRNLYVLHHQMAKDGLPHYSPQVYEDLSGHSVVTMEKLEGVWMRELLDAVRAKDETRLAIWSERGITPAGAARLVFRSVLEQCFTHRLFHADPHAGNIVLMEGGRLGWVDFGMVGWLDEKVWSQQWALNEALAQEKTHRAYQALVASLEPLTTRDLSHFKSDVKTLLMDWILAIKTPGTSLRRRSSAALFLHLFDLIRREGLNMPAPSLRLSRALMISDMIVLQLYPEFDRLTELGDYFRNRKSQRFHEALAKGANPSEWFGVGLGLVKVASAITAAAEWATLRLPEQGIRYEARLSILEQVTALLVSYARWLAWLLVGAILGGHYVAPWLRPHGSWQRATERLGGDWWVAALLLAALALLLGQIRRKFQ